ncbi:MAG: hypothetical protein ACI4F7_05705 [Acutalibacteraceae bacterium]|jgi:hypothetical protein
MTPEMQTTAAIMAVSIIAILVIFLSSKGEKKELKWHSDMLLGFKDDEIKSLQEKISALESQIAVKDTIISELGRVNNTNNDRLWDMNGVLLEKVTKKKEG